MSEEEGAFVSASAVPHYDGRDEIKRGSGTEAAKTGAPGGKFSEAERRLREELAAFKLK